MHGDPLVMNGQTLEENASIYREVGIALGMTHSEIGELLGVSRRTYSRWASQGAWLFPDSAATLASLLFEKDRALAQRLVTLAGLSLDELGLGPAPFPAAAPLAAPHLSARTADAVVCAAAEALDASPRAVRPALLAAVRCARELGFTLEALESILTPAPPPKPNARKR